MTWRMMPTRAWLLTAVALAGVSGALGEGCGDDSALFYPEAGAPDSSKSDATVMTDGSGTDAPIEAAPIEAAPCMDAAFNVATFDSGSANWACFQAGCPDDLNACAAECDCNTSLANGLLCAADAAPLADGAVDTAAQQVCVNARLLRLTTDAGRNVQMCLNGQLATCLLHTGDGGDAAPVEGGDSGGGDGGDGGDATTE